MRFKLERPVILDYFHLNLGTVAGCNPFNLPIDRLARHVLVCGQSGSGKSRLAMNLSVRAENHMQNQRVKLLVIDVEGEWKAILSLLREGFQYYDVGKNLQINPFDLKDPALIRELMQETVFKGIEKDYSDLSAQMNFVLNHAISKSSNMAELIRNIKSYDGQKLTAIERTKTALLVRLQPFLQSPLKEIFLCKESSIDFERMAEQNVLVDLHSLDAKVAYSSEIRLIYNTITTYYLRRMLNRGARSFVSNLFVADEAQLLVPRILRKLVVTESWPATSIGVRLRKRGCGMVLITQSPSNIEPDIFKNCGTKIVFRLQHPEDIKLISDSCGFVDQTEYQFLSDRIVRLADRQTVVCTTDHEPFLAWSAKFDTPRQEPVAISATQKVIEDHEKTKHAALNPDETRFLETLSEKPFLSRTQRKNHLNFDSHRYSETVDSLIQKGVIEKVNIFTGSGRPRVLYQKKGKIPSIRHEFYVNHIISALKKKGIRAAASQVGPDIVIPELDTAVNVELGTSDIKGNLRSALEKFGTVVTCSYDQKVLEKIPKTRSGIKTALIWNVSDQIGVSNDKGRKKKQKNVAAKKRKVSQTSPA